VDAFLENGRPRAKKRYGRSKEKRMTASSDWRKRNGSFRWFPQSRRPSSGYPEATPAMKTATRSPIWRFRASHRGLDERNDDGRVKTIPARPV